MRLSVDYHIIPGKVQKIIKAAHFYEKKMEISLENYFKTSKPSKFDGVIFLAGSPHESSVIRPIYNKMLKQNLKPIWLQNFVLHKNYLYVTARAPPPKIIRKNAIWVSHGVGNEYPEPWNLEFMYCFLPGPYWYRKFCQKIPSSQLKIIGYPKLDILFSDSIEALKKHYIEKYDLKLPYDKTILYSPTSTLYSPKNPSFEKAIFEILKTSREFKINLIIKAHPNLHRCVSPSIFSNIKVNSNKLVNVRWISPTEDIVPFYMFADVLISDMSSTLREFMMTNKPSIQLTDFIPKEDLFDGVILSSIEELPQKVILALNNSKDYVYERQNAVKDLFFKPDGHASERAVAIIKRILEK